MDCIKYKDDLLKYLKGRGINCNLDNPKTIQEKIHWLKIYDSTPLKTKCADKVLLHEYSKEKLGKDICIPIIKTYDSVEEINWDELPNRFVMKCNHGSAMNIIVKDKNTLNKESAKNRLKKWMETDFAFFAGYELHYHDIKRKIFAEEFIGNENEDLIDYKISCFNGEPKILQVMSDRFKGALRINYYDLNFKPLGYSRNDHPADYNIPDKKPLNLDTMIEYSKKLSQDFKYVRVDFYNIKNKVYLGELTFTPGSGLFTYKNIANEKEIGDMLRLK